MKTVRYGLFLSPVLALAGCMDMPPSGTGIEDLAAYDAAVATVGCQLVTEADYGAVQFQAGLTREQTIAITEQRLARDEAVRLDSGGVRLISGSCAA
ncbi:hypothetical protein [Marinovum sp.]|uniref:hypothetical protein n=1 Tax=Marinovum sp. TaxID=2024839 RepID=UPI003A92C792